MNTPFSSPKNTVHDFILSELKVYPNLSANDLYLRYASNIKKCSPQAIYKELAGLVDKGFLIKLNKKYRLHLSYVNFLLEQADKLNSVYYEDLQEPFILKDKQKAKYKFQNLYRLNDFWLNTSFALIKSAKLKEYYSWNPYSWFYVLQPNQEKIFLKALQTKGFITYKIVSDDVVGNKYARIFIQSALSKNKTNFSSRDSYFNSQKNSYFTIIDDFIIKVELSQKATDFVRTEIIGGNKANFSSLSKINLPAWISLEHNVSKAKFLKKKFKDFF